MRRRRVWFNRPRSSLGGGFARLLSAATVSGVGDGLALTAFPLLAAHLTPSPILVSLVTAAEVAPWLVVGLVSGAVVDRSDRRRLMWRTDAARTLLVAALAITVFAGRIDILALALFAAGIGVGTCFFDNASQALVPALVGTGTEPLSRASARLNGAEVVSEQLAGPALGGVLFAAAHAAPFAIDAASFAMSAALIASIRGEHRARREPPATPPLGQQPSTSIRQSLAEGIGYLFRHRLLRTLAMATGVINLAFTAGEAVLVLFAERRLHLSPAGYGLLYAVGAVGGLTGSAVAGPLSRRWHRSAILRTSLAVLPCSTLVIALAPDAVVCGAGLALLAAAVIVFNVAVGSLRPQLIPDILLGRVVAAYRVVGVGAAPVGALLGGAVADQFGLRAPYLAATPLLLMMVAMTVPILTRTVTEPQVAPRTLPTLSPEN